MATKSDELARGYEYSAPPQRHGQWPPSGLSPGSLYTGFGFSVTQGPCQKAHQVELALTEAVELSLVDRVDLDGHAPGKNRGGICHRRPCGGAEVTA